MQILHAGHGSTIDVMDSRLHALLTPPAQTARLRADPGLMPAAVQAHDPVSLPITVTTH